ncbi:MAG: hypothetical protein EBR82_43100 [Caulobacteraceae bacterium]|nr:hypothetical protein [Caulobacteraceae bacterium]
MNKCAHTTLNYQAVVSGNDYWQCVECGQRFIPDNRDFIDACSKQQSAIQTQVDEYKQGRAPAYPAYYHDYQPGTGEQVVRAMDNGITIRDYFAAAALTGYCANPSTCHKGFGHEEADYCYKIADQMIHERNDDLPL